MCSDGRQCNRARVNGQDPRFGKAVTCREVDESYPEHMFEMESNICLCDGSAGHFGFDYILVSLAWLIIAKIPI